jgi:hypothetical protein
MAQRVRLVDSAWSINETMLEENERVSLLEL